MPGWLPKSCNFKIQFLISGFSGILKWALQGMKMDPGSGAGVT
jgi:hypothetical protein